MAESQEPHSERISEAEHAVMEALWESSPLTAVDVCDQVCEQRGWSMPTVKTLLSRLVAKGAVGTEPDGRRFLYSPLIERSDYVGGESRRLVDRLFGGRAAPLFAQLAESEALSDDDLAEIERLLKELRKMNAWLFDTFVYTGVLIGAVLVLRRPVGRIFGAQLAYALWALPLLRLLLPPIVLPASLAPAPEAAPVAANGAEPAAEAIVWDALAEPAAALVEPAAVAVTASAPAVSAPGLFATASLAEIALSAWLGGALAFLAWRIVTYRRMRREVLAGARPVGEVGRIRLVETAAVAAPVAFGVRDKIIALPPLFMAQPDLTARDLAIEHELAHHRGHDLLANFAAQAVLALHWFNPLAWYGWRAMRRDQEAACDARVLTGRGRQERALYAALIADIAAGPRLALAAPMACPVLGERSIVHRLRSLSMAEISNRRRWLGRSLVAAGAFALPLTASISYSGAAQAQAAPQPPAAPLPPTAIIPVDPSAPEAPAAPAAVGDADAARTIVSVVRDGEEGGARIVREISVNRDGRAMPMPRPVPTLRLERGAMFDPEDPRFEAEMERFEREMETWGEEMEQWGERFGEQFAADAQAQAVIIEQAARYAPEVVQSCDADEARRTITADGRQRIVICELDIQRIVANSSLRQARDSIARNREMDAQVRNEVLRDLDKEIARLEREDG